MRVKEFIKPGRSFLCTGLFLFSLFSSFSWAGVTANESRMPNFVADVGNDFFVQTSEVTIKLEKSILRRVLHYLLKLLRELYGPLRTRKSTKTWKILLQGMKKVSLS